MDIDQVLFFFGVFINRDGVHKHTKKERDQYPAILTEVAWPIRNLLHGKGTLLSCGTKRVISCGQDSTLLAITAQDSAANHRAGFGFSCPVTEQAM